MPVQTIITGEDHPTLRAKAAMVTKFDTSLKKLVQDLLETVEAAEGAGLAAPQIDISQRILVARIGERYTPFINPEIRWQSEKRVMGEEGCLSLPNVWLMIPRAEEIVLTYQNEKGEEQERKFTGFDARVLQHEVDHLNGVLIVDYVRKGDVHGDHAVETKQL